MVAAQDANSNSGSGSGSGAAASASGEDAGDRADYAKRFGADGHIDAGFKTAGGELQVSDAAIRRARDILARITPLVKSHRASALDFVETIEADLAPFGGIAISLAEQIDNYDYRNAMDTIAAFNSMLSDAENGIRHIEGDG
jgi:hypothetical protein